MRWPSRWDGLSLGWLRILTVGAFQIGDVLGRQVASVESLWVKESWLLPVCLIRCLFLPFICSPGASVSIGFVAFLMQLLVPLLLGLTNGWFSTVGCVYAPRKVADSEKGLVGRILGFAIIGGIMGGSWIAHIFQETICVKFF
eukprot:GHVN01057444.1.p1 GENE.GHVN01057444.1~~GHVN01057444.1.p1  ORF type:complete len:143 (+),score=6.09 GHVN01057444.1:3-431(+)